MSEKGLVVEFTVPQRKNQPDKEPPPKDPVPRIARLLALAHKWDGMVRRGEVKDYAEIARLMRLSRARVTQVCQLTLLAPGIQEVVLVSPSSQDISERSLRRASSCVNWSRQRNSLGLASPTAQGSS